MDENTVPSYQLLWAKTSKDKSTTHPLICHMIDVAQVAWAMWNDVLTASMRAHLATALGLDEEPAGASGCARSAGERRRCTRSRAARTTSPMRPAGRPHTRTANLLQNGCEGRIVAATHILDVGLDITCPIVYTERGRTHTLLQRAGGCVRYGVEELRRMVEGYGEAVGPQHSKEANQ